MRLVRVGVVPSWISQVSRQDNHSCLVMVEGEGEGEGEVEAEDDEDEDEDRAM